MPGVLENRIEGKTIVAIKDIDAVYPDTVSYTEMDVIGDRLSRNGQTLRKTEIKVTELNICSIPNEKLWLNLRIKQY